MFQYTLNSIVFHAVHIILCNITYYAKIQGWDNIINVY